MCSVWNEQQHTEYQPETTHAGSQKAIVFIDTTSLYFNCLVSVQDVFKRSCAGHIMAFWGFQKF